MRKSLLLRLYLAIFLLSCVSGVVYGQDTAPLEPDREMTLLKSPKAGYTDVARRKDLNGTVRLRILFQADGTIGEIVDITTKKREKLIKYGLTAKAIEAAKTIAFQPAIRSGIPVSIVRVVEYVFSTY
jgi:hypothetical protein